MKSRVLKNCTFDRTLGFLMRKTIISNLFKIVLKGNNYKLVRKLFNKTLHSTELVKFLTIKINQIILIKIFLRENYNLVYNPNLVILIIIVFKRRKLQPGL